MPTSVAAGFRCSPVMRLSFNNSEDIPSRLPRETGISPARPGGHDHTGDGRKSTLRAVCIVSLTTRHSFNATLINVWRRKKSEQKEALQTVVAVYYRFDSKHQPRQKQPIRQKLTHNRRRVLTSELVTPEID